MILRILIIGGLVLISLSSYCFRKKTVIGKWQLKLVKVNGEKIFDRNDSTVSLNYNYSLNSPKDKEDSLAVESMSTIAFRKTKSIVLLFDSDSSFVTTKIRSGGRIEPEEEKEVGSYFQSNDALYMTIPERNNYKYTLQYKKRKDILYSKIITEERRTYIEYERIH